jgi:small subunit ribosomal protein S12
MVTENQLCKTQLREPRRQKNRRLSLQKCPQKRGTCIKAFVVTPRKPNSALRKVARIVLTVMKKNKKIKGKKITAYIPGIKHSLQKYSAVLVRGGRVKDIPGMKYTLVRGKFDLKPVENRKTARSKYGVRLSRILTRGIDYRYHKTNY